MSLISDLAREDFLWDAIAANIHNSRPSRSADFNINCPMCVRLGERRPDSKRRCGISKQPDGFVVNCFNCPLALRWTYGSLVSERLRDFMVELGVPELEVKRMAHRAYAINRTVQSSPLAYDIIGESFLPDFKEIALPEGARPLHEWVADGCDDPRFLRAVTYIYGRGTDIAESRDFYWTPIAHETRAADGGSDRMNERIIIPFTFKGKVVGYSARATTDGISPKYWSRSPDNYLFNNEVLSKKARKYVFVIEGPMDAAGVDGVATLGAKLNDKQAAWINSSGLKPILVADRDHSGMRNIDNALKHGWGVSFPRLASTGWWDSNITDCGKAVEEYGRLFVVRSIIENITFDKQQIEVRRRLAV